jgi:hypothetical protein
MIWHGGNPSLWQHLLVALLIIGVASTLRALFFGGLGRGIPRLHYYHSVMLAASCGGLPAGPFVSQGA